MDFGRFEILTFDCYGTLIDWEAGILGALRPLLAAHGVALGNDEVLECYARLEAAAEEGPFRRYEDVLRAVVEGFGRELGFAPSADEVSCLGRTIGDWPPFPDTVEALRVLGGRFRLGILSNVDDALFARTARRLEAPFDVVVTAEQVGAYKPSPEGFRRLLERAAVAPQRLLHVAQSLHHDVAPARALGLATVWVNRRGGRGGGATPPSSAVPDLEVPDLASLAAATG